MSLDRYNTVPAAHLKRSMFHWKKERYQSQDFGAIVPFFFREVLPGDVWKIAQSNFIRVQPMVAAPFTPMRFYSEFWYFPTRVLMKKFDPSIVDAWETFIFGGPEGNGQNEAGQTPIIPIWVPNSKNVKLAGINVTNNVQSRKTGNADAKGSLWDYFGLPVNQGYNDLDDDGCKTVDNEKVDYSAYCPHAFGKIAYNYLWNTFKRNEFLEPSVDLMSDDIQLCKWKKDRYTSALPYQQLTQDPIALPISGIGGISFSDPLSVDFTGNMKIAPENHLDETASIQYLSSVGHYAKFPTTSGDPSGSVFTVKNNFAGAVPKAESSKMAVDFSQASSVTIPEFRLAIQTQKWLERAARGGVRYIEGLVSFFGTAPRSDVLDLPQFIGGMKQNIIVNEVLQQSETTESSPQGNIAGRGISAAGNNVGTFHSNEHGYILGICWIKPDLYYSSQGVRKEWLRKSKFDYYWPQYAHLAEQPIARSELFASPATMTPAQMGSGAEGMLGYQGIFDEYRTSENEICGEMRDTFAYWHVARKFSSAPELNADFINCFPRKDIFAVKDEDPFLLDILTDVKVWRPIPIEPIPGLVDHF